MTAVNPVSYLSRGSFFAADMLPSVLRSLLELVLLALWVSLYDTQ